MDDASEPRALEILDSVKAIFASKGFDGASMQDLARAAGMSASNFYRYFPSKSAIIVALVEREFAETRARFAEVLRSPEPRATFRELVRQRMAGTEHLDASIWAEIEAAANRRPEFAELLAQVEREISRNLIAVLARIAGMSEAEAEQRYRAHARLIILLVQSVSMRCGARAGASDEELAALVMRTIDAILSEVAAAGRPAPATAAARARP